jgi:hypothetical protein
MRKNWVTALSWPAARVLWKRFHDGFDPGFAAWMDDQLAKAASRLAISAAALNSEIAAEIAASEQPR